ncbi:DUF38 domain-containing protein [Caenorhabditis elegans]|uniref:DUF38 domain-containing protein n=1 Tax=Caenorhabditis elegans TaxID=6239 RepID=O16666_CAEEL|nr:DUF38 domain-containing protein [Caenorhabditis elegans]CCD74248.2 DUF38 domain-containing protein [Caenorhabditis elegans]|eukprot:NP_503625.2 F-box A protein [Caenorhabditis elegans]
MQVDTLNWSALPLGFKQKVVNILDFETRNSLLRCSKTDHQIVGKCPVAYQQLEISTNHKFLTSQHKNTKFAFKIKALSFQNKFFWQTRYLEKQDAVDHFMILFKNRNSFVQSVRIKNGRDIESFLYHLLLRMRKEQEENNCRVKIKAREIEWEGGFRTEYVYLLELLSYFDTSVLRIIKIKSYYMLRDAVDRLIATKQFRNAKEVHICPMMRIPIEPFLHLDSFEISMTSVKSDDVVTLMKKFQQKLTPNNCHFRLTNEEKLEDDFLNDVFQKLGIAGDGPERESISTDEKNHISKFPTVEEKSWLLVKFEEYSVFGVIVSSDFLASLKYDVLIFMTLRELGFDCNCPLLSLE